jgi:predicted O-linked N-acetylglucosamine transferase (SPINDLY family)
MRQRLSLAESLNEEIWRLPETFQQGDRKKQTATDFFNTEESGLCRRD